MANSQAVSENEKQGENTPAVILIAHLQAHLVSGESIQLLPIRHENDVKSDVTKLLEDWAQSGFLLRGHIAYPWHQVQSVEIMRIEELAPHEAHQRMLELEGSSRAQIANGFWKTRETSQETSHDEPQADEKQK